MQDLHAVYSLKKSRIHGRLSDFKSFYTNSVSWFFDNGSMELRPVSREHDERIFEELSFCLLTANTSAVMGMKGVDSLRDILMTGNVDDFQRRLVSCGYRFPNVRAQYIFEARENFKQKHGFGIRKIIESYSDPKDAREFFVNEVKGLGYKEASHFLRNIGVFGLAILDKHIINTLHEYGVIDETPKSLNKNKYLEIESKFTEFCNTTGINMDEMDILLWSMKSGSIMK